LADTGGRCLHFARNFGRGRGAVAFGDIPLQFKGDSDCKHSITQGDSNEENRLAVNRRANHSQLCADYANAYTIQTNRGASNAYITAKRDETNRSNGGNQSTYC
jgi:hypothetical protein